MISAETLGVLILEVEEDCSTQFCHELHDGLSQLLMALQAHLQVHDLASRAGRQEKADDELAKSRECLNQAVRECRRLVSGQAGEERELANSLQTLLRESSARWNWAEASFHDLRDSAHGQSSPRAARLVVLLCRRLFSAFRRKSGIEACLELRSDLGPPESLCVEMTVTGEALSPLSYSMGTSSTTDEILKRTQGLTEALGGVFNVEWPSPTELHLAVVIPAGEQRPGTSHATSHDTKEASHGG